MSPHREDTDEPLEPSGIAQFVEHDRCPRYLKQRVEPGEEATARDWQEAFGLMNIALLGHGREFEATQVEALATDATTIIGPSIADPEKAGVPDIAVDETWAASAQDRVGQLHEAIREASTLTPDDDEIPYVLLYQAPLGGHIGDHAVHGEADCIALAPADAVDRSGTPTSTKAPTDATTPTAETEQQTGEQTADAGVVARVIDCKSAHEEHPGHRVQVATYCALFEQTLAEGPADCTCRIEASVLTQSHATSGDASTPFALPTFRRAEWELFVTRLLAEDGPIDGALATELGDLPFTLDQVCNNCAYREACATRAVENPTEPASLAVLGLDASVQRALREAGVTNIRELSTLLPRLENPRPTDAPPDCELPPAQRRALEEALPGPIHETVQRAQALRGTLDPDYPSDTRPPALAGTDWVPLPDDRCQGWSNIESARPGELVHVALFVRPDSALDRVAALGACVSAEAYDEYITIGEKIDALPDDPGSATDAEERLFARFLQRLFDAIETVATALGTPAETVMHCYTYSEHAKETLAEGLDRHADSLDRARALRALWSLHPDGHTDVDQSMVSAVQPCINDHFALQYPSQGLLAVLEQFVPTWTIDAFDPLDGRPNEPPLRAIFREQFLNERVPYLETESGIRLHTSPGPLAEGPAAEAVARDADRPTPDGWYPVRKRAGGQFPIEYIWAVTPTQPGDDTPRLTPAVVEEWAVEDEHRSLYAQEINRFYYRTSAQDEPLTRGDVEYLLERLGYALLRLVEAIPYKDAYHPKAPIDATQLSDFTLPVGRLPEAARDYLRMEFGAQRDATRAHYRQSLRDRARSGRSVPMRCTEYELHDDGSLTIAGTLAYDALFDDRATATQVARQARVRGATGTGSGSWRVLTRLTHTATSEHADTSPAVAPSTDGDPSARGYTEATVPTPTALQHSPPVLVEHIDQHSGTITLRAFPHRFQQNGSEFRRDHCGWHCSAGSNLESPTTVPPDRPGYVAGRPPVWIDTDEVFMLDPMIDDFGAPKADRALHPDTIDHNQLYQQLRAIRQTGQQQAAAVCAPGDVEAFLETMAGAETCLDPNERQRSFIRAVDRALVPLQGPPGTGKTSGATAPALLARAYARARHDRPFLGIVVAPSHEAVDAVLDGVVAGLDDWRRAPPTGGLATLRLVRVVPSAPPAAAVRADATTSHVSVTYCNYHSDDGEATLRQLARDLSQPQSHAAGEGDEAPTQCLLFATPSTLYRTLGVVADTLPAIDGTTAPAAMRHAPGLADVVCVDEASMLDVPRLLVAGSVLKPAGQTLLVGDHRQLATVTSAEWTDPLRKPLAETQAHRSALDYVRWLITTATGRGGGPTVTPTNGDGRQTHLSAFEPRDDDTTRERGGDR